MSEQVAKTDEKIKLEVSKSNMEAYISFEQATGEGQILKKGDIHKFLKNHQIVFGLNDELICQLEEQRNYGRTYLVAQGSKPINGENSSIKYLCDIDSKKMKPHVREDGSVDFHNLNLFEIATKGQVLAMCIPPTEGTSGFNVYGVKIPGFNGKNTARLPCGINTYLSEDGKELIADVGGQILYANNKINIQEVYEVRGEVGVSTGDIIFAGSVVVRGDVLADYKIIADGNVEIYGVVEGAEIRSGGNVYINNGLFGMGKASISVKGNLTAKLIKDANVTVEGDIYADGIMHSNISCIGRIECLGNKGLVIGGKISAKQGVIAKEIGSPKEASTEITVGLDAELLDRLRIQVKELTDQKTRLAELALVLGDISKKKDLNLSDKTKRSYLNTVNEYQNIKKEIEELDKNLALTKLKIAKDRHSGLIYANKTIYPGVKLQVGNASFMVTNPILSSIVVNEGGQAKVEYCDLQSVSLRSKK